MHKTTFEHKYQVGDILYVINCNNVAKVTVNKVCIHDGVSCYRVSFSNGQSYLCDEKDLYVDKEKLKESLKQKRIAGLKKAIEHATLDIEDAQSNIAKFRKTLEELENNP